MDHSKSKQTFKKSIAIIIINITIIIMTSFLSNWLLHRGWGEGGGGGCAVWRLRADKVTAQWLRSDLNRRPFDSKARILRCCGRPLWCHHPTKILPSAALSGANTEDSHPSTCPGRFIHTHFNNNSTAVASGPGILRLATFEIACSTSPPSASVPCLSLC